VAVIDPKRITTPARS